MELTNQYLTFSWVITILYLIGMVWIGLYCSKKQGDMEDFYIGGRKLGVFVLMGTFAATWTSGGSALGIMGVIYEQGVSYLWVQIVSWVGGLFCILFTVDKLRQSGKMTISELLGERYDSKVVTIASSVLQAVLFVIFFVVQFKAAGVVAEVFLGIRYEVALILFGTVIILYSSFGGFMAVSLTDLVQAIIIAAGIIIASIVVLKNVGGYGSLMNQAAKVDPALVTSEGPGGWMGTAAIIQQMLLWTGYNSTAAHTCVRYFAGQKRSTTILGIGLGWFFCYVIGVCQQIIGIGARVKIPVLSNMDYAFPILMNQILPWFGAIINVAVIAAVMSTIDSGLLVVSSCITKDIYLTMNPNAPQEKMLKLSKYVTFIAGIIALLLALNPPESIWFFYAFVWAILVSGLFLPLMLGLYTRWANKYGVIASMFLAVPTAVLWQLYPLIPTIQPVGAGLIVSLLCMIGGKVFAPKYETPSKILDKYVPVKQ